MSPPVQPAQEVKLVLSSAPAAGATPHPFLGPESILQLGILLVPQWWRRLPNKAIAKQTGCDRLYMCTEEVALCTAHGAMHYSTCAAPLSAQCQHALATILPRYPDSPCQPLLRPKNSSSLVLRCRRYITQWDVARVVWWSQLRCRTSLTCVHCQSYPSLAKGSLQNSYILDQHMQRIGLPQVVFQSCSLATISESRAEQARELQVAVWRSP